MRYALCVVELFSKPEPDQCALALKGVAFWPEMNLNLNLVTVIEPEPGHGHRHGHGLGV